MSTINRVEDKIIRVGQYTLKVAAVYVDVDSNRSLSRLSIIEAIIRDIPGAVINASYGAISSSYQGYDGGLNAIDYSFENFHLVQTVRQASSNIQVFSASLFYNSHTIVDGFGSYGYSGGNPWVEVMLATVFIDNASGNFITGLVQGYNMFLKNGENGVTVVSNENLYNVLVQPDSTIGGGGSPLYLEFGITELNSSGIVVPVIPGNDPYNPNPEDPSGGGGIPYSPVDPIGGGGSFELEIDPIPEPTVPTISAVDCGFVTLYNPTLAQLNQLSQYLWSDLFSLDTLKKLFADPMDIILSLMIVPVEVPDGGQREVTVGGLPTGVTMTLAAKQYIEVDCGSVTLKPFFGSYLDYSPYTKIQLFLPFIGFVDLDADEVQGRTINVKYSVDIATGACSAFVYVSSSSNTRAGISPINGPLYSYAGQCAQPVPVTGSNWSELVSSVIQVGATIAGGAIGGLSGAATGASAAAMNGINQAVDIGGELAEAPATVNTPYGLKNRAYRPNGRMISSTAPGNTEEIEPMLTPLSPVAQSVDFVQSSKTRIAGMTASTGTVAGLVNSVIGSKPKIQHSGSMGAVAGLMGIKTPFLVITRPHLTLAEGYHKLCGYPQNATIPFSELSGYTEVEACRLEYMNCTMSEMEEIYNFLHSGVVF